jgi:hypothetical protein
MNLELTQKEKTKNPSRTRFSAGALEVGYLFRARLADTAAGHFIRGKIYGLLGDQ